MGLIVNKELKVEYHLVSPYYSDIKKINSTLENVITNKFFLEKAYIKILSITGDKNKIRIKVGTHTSNKENLLTVEVVEFTPSVSNTSYNFIKQGYEYLKTLPEYANAIDVLEEGQS